MRSILIVARYRNIGSRTIYNVHIWSCTVDSGITLVAWNERLELRGYLELWDVAKIKCANYWNDPKFKDGAYCKYIDQLNEDLDLR